MRGKWTCKFISKAFRSLSIHPDYLDEMLCQFRPRLLLSGVVTTELGKWVYFSINHHISHRTSTGPCGESLQFFATPLSQY